MLANYLSTTNNQEVEKYVIKKCSKFTFLLPTHFSA